MRERTVLPLRQLYPVVKVDQRYFHSADARTSEVEQGGQGARTMLPFVNRSLTLLENHAG
jgi:hypothetical protein